MNAVITITNQGTATCLYTELIDLRCLGRLEIRRATEIEFNNQTQHWEVKNLQGRLLYFSRSRQDCLDWERGNL